MAKNRVFAMKFSGVYPHYVAKAEKKGRTKAEVDKIICWLTGYTPTQFKKQLKAEVSVETFYMDAPEFHPNASLIKGVVCGVRVEEVEDPLMRKIRYLDKLIEELARGRAMEKILRT
ncbi:MAG: DUF2200 domain-containing protein [Planctomycetota bacterium]